MILVPIHTVPNRSCKAKGRALAEVVAHAIIDDDRADLTSYFWTLHSGYAVRRHAGRTIFMHHDVIGRSSGKDVSHENANKLDNRRDNLVHASRSENVLNESDAPRRNRKSCEYRGVSRDDRSRRLARPWRGKVTVNGKIYQTSRFASAEDARDALRALKERLRVREIPEVRS